MCHLLFPRYQKKKAKIQKSKLLFGKYCLISRRSLMLNTCTLYIDIRQNSCWLETDMLYQLLPKKILLRSHIFILQVFETVAILS